MRHLLCRVWHGGLVPMSDGFEWCADCDRDYWRGKPWDGVTTPEPEETK